jgi:hypothetical protein
MWWTGDAAADRARRRERSGMLASMTDTGADPNPASFARHDIDAAAPDDPRGGTEQASFDRHDVDVDAPDAVQEVDEATFDRHDVDTAGPDAVDEEDEATYDRHDTQK